MLHSKSRGAGNNGKYLKLMIIHRAVITIDDYLLVFSREISLLMTA